MSRIHKALNAAKARGDIEYVFSENVANTDYERVMREYAEAGNQLIVGEAFGVERAAREVAKDYPEDRVPDGLELRPAGAELLRCSTTTSRSAAYLTGMVAGRADQDRTRSAWSAAIRSPRSTG